MKKIETLIVVALSIFGLSNGVLYTNEDSPTDDNIIMKFEKFSESRYKRQSTIVPSEINTVKDDHSYYTSEYHAPGPTADSLWFDISSLENENVNLDSGVLSSRYRAFSFHPLLFEFPYYGHYLSSVAVTTGGFLYTSNYSDSSLVPLTHAIAPLQADFNPSLNDSARILIHSTEESFTVQWDKVHNHDHFDEGPFTFQVTLYQDGKIVFAYREIPLGVGEIDNDGHPVDVGLSDSFYIDTPVSGGVFVRSVFEYSRISLNASDQLSYSAYVLTPVINCIVGRSCEECSNLTSSTQFECEWCPTVSRCSDGIDRYSQEWFDSECSTTARPTCFEFGPAVSAGGAVGISIGLVLVVGLVVFVLGAIVIVYIGYKRPTSRLGLWLIENRPKARTLNKTSASYDVDTGKTELQSDISQ